MLESQCLLGVAYTISSCRLREQLARAGRVFLRLSVCLFFPHDISKTVAAGITKLDIEMLHNEFWKPIYIGVKRSKVKSHNNSAGVGLYTLLSVGF